MNGLSEYELLKLSKYLDTDQWTAVGQNLGVPLPKIDHINKIYKNESNAEKAHRMLLEWKEIFPFECNLTTLLDTLKDMRLNDTSLQMQKCISAETSQVLKPNADEEINELVQISTIKFYRNNTIGVGPHSIVFKGQFKKRDVAVKEVDTAFSRRIEREISILKRLRGDRCIVNYFGNEEHEGFCYIVLELCQGNLNDYIDSKEKFSREDLHPKKVLQQITEGLAYLHGNQIVHRDLKPVHILISAPDKMPRRAVLSSFGQSKNLSDDYASKRCHEKGNSGYTAYEILERHNISKAADIFSLGCIYYFVISNGNALFHSDFDVLSRPPMLEISDENMKLMILCMIQRNPAKRSSCAQILADPFFLDSSPKKARVFKERRLSVNAYPSDDQILPIRAQCFYTMPLQLSRNCEHAKSRDDHYRRIPSENSQLNLPSDVIDGPRNEDAPPKGSSKTLFEISKVNYDGKSILGVGPQSTIVFRGHFDGKKAAIKRLDKSFSYLAEENIQLLISVGHPNILPYYGKEENRRFYYLAMEECQGNLRNYMISKEGFAGKAINRKTLILQITEGLKFLHDKQLVHGNINPFNIFIAYPNEQLIVRAMISDSGIGKKDLTGKQIFECPGFNSYEALEGNTSDLSMDIFSLGCIYFYIVSNRRQLFYSDFDVKYTNPDMSIFTYSKTKKYFELVRILIVKMTSRIPDERPSCKEVLNSISTIKQ